MIARKGGKTMTFVYKPQGVCSRQFTITVEDGVIRDLRVVGGCIGVDAFDHRIEAREDFRELLFAEQVSRRPQCDHGVGSRNDGIPYAFCDIE